MELDESIARRSIVSYVSPVYFVLFLPITLLLYQLTPKKFRWGVLLFSSLVFYVLISKWQFIFVLLTTLLIYLYGLGINYIDTRKNSSEDESSENRRELKKHVLTKKKRFLKIVISLILLILIVLKYTPFISKNIQAIVSSLSFGVEIPIMKFIVPLGISFYSLQAVSYCVDIYRGVVQPEKNFLKLCLYLCFFPTIMQGPITRYSDISPSLYAGDSITMSSFSGGLQRIIWGFFKKIVIADRLNALVSAILDVNHSNFSGSVILFGALIYTIQLYMDFSGIVDICIGTSDIFNIKIPENFRQPFFAKTVTEFWKRWHMTLGAWLKDYVFYPVMLSRHIKSLTKKTRKKLGKNASLIITNTIALFVVWLCNGFWHGAGWNFVLYGIYYFTLITLALIFEPVFKKIKKRLRLDKHTFSLRFLQTLKMSVIIIFGELIFRVESIQKLIMMLKNVIFKFQLSDFVNGLNSVPAFKIIDIGVVFFALIVVFVVNLLKEKGLDPFQMVFTWPTWARWSLTYTFILVIVIFGAYGNGYAPVDIIYAGF
ncbi:MAG: MBOAT family O-acyltransferase [Erysipelothrix sp.]